MRKPDLEVREVVCSETGKPMAKIPMWMADVKVKFISDEARQKHPPVPGLVDVDPVRRSSSSGAIEGLKDLDVVAGLEDGDADGDADVDEDVVEEEAGDDEL